MTPPTTLSDDPGWLRDDDLELQAPIGRSNSARGPKDGLARNATMRERQRSARSPRSASMTTDDVGDSAALDSFWPRPRASPRAIGSVPLAPGPIAPSPAPLVPAAKNRLCASTSSASNSAFFAESGISSGTSGRSRGSSPARPGMAMSLSTDDLGKDDTVLAVPRTRDRGKSQEASTILPTADRAMPAATSGSTLPSPSSAPPTTAQLRAQRERDRERKKEPKTVIVSIGANQQPQPPQTQSPQPLTPVPPTILEGVHLNADGSMMEMNQKMSEDEQLWKQQVLRTLRSRTISTILSGTYI
jgi:hypothetical protein